MRIFYSNKWITAIILVFLYSDLSLGLETIELNQIELYKKADFEKINPNIAFQINEHLKKISQQETRVDVKFKEKKSKAELQKLGFALDYEPVARIVNESLSINQILKLSAHPDVISIHGYMYLQPPQKGE